MKYILPFCFFLCLACGSKPTTEAESNDTIQVAPNPTVSDEPKDTLVAETTTKPVVKEELKEKKETGPKPLLCKFQKLESGECLRYVFDCATFGLEAMSLPKDQADVWNSLMTFDGSHGDEPIANAQYVGKTFEILQTVMERDVCQNGNMVKRKESTITMFKLDQ